MAAMNSADRRRYASERVGHLSFVGEILQVGREA